MKTETKQQPKLKLQIDTNLKTIKVEGLTSLKELFDGLEKLLPKDSPFGSWKEFKLDTTTQIVYWTNPLFVPYQQNTYPWWNTQINYNSDLTTGTADGGITYTSAGTTYVSFNEYYTNKAGVDKYLGIYNIELN